MQPMTPDQQELVNTNLNLAYYFSHQWQAPRGMCQADWTAECWYYLTMAAIKFDPAQSKNFPGYATKVMQNGWKACQKRMGFKCRDISRVVACSHEVDVVDYRDQTTGDAVDEAAVLVRGIIQRLPLRWQPVITLRLRGKSYSHIGRVLRCSKETVRKQHDMALRYMARRWGDRLNG
jgi:RNA polymerase sigma factor (sigma-70 family)